MLAERKSLGLNEGTRVLESAPNTVEFEGISIQWDKKSWEFENGEGKNTVDTYSIWNPKNWEDITSRLKDGQTCGMYIMGNYGTGEIREAPEWEKKEGQADALFDKIKKRAKEQNFVAFADPEDLIKIIDIDRLPESMKDFRWAHNRLKSYAGPQHNIFPVRNNGTVNSGLIRKDDNTIACFWIPQHWGYEGIADKLKKKTKHGIFGGGSLNVHGQEPSYTTEELKNEFLRQPDWQENIDFIIFDEIAEQEQIGRSQSMISFVSDKPTLVRIGSLSPEEISRKTGFEIEYNNEDITLGKIRKASSISEYNEQNNDDTNQKVKNVMERINRYEKWYKSNF